MLSHVARHPRLLAGGLLVLGVAALIGPAVLISLLGLPLWFLVGPVVLSAVAFGGAFAVARGSLVALLRAHARPELEHRILDLAARMGGQLTVALTARELAISLTEAEDALMAIARAGHVEIGNDPESAAVTYVFCDLDAQSQPSRSPRGLSR